MVMRPEEVVIGDPERKVEDSVVYAVVAAGVAVRSLEGAIEPFDQLLEGTELFGDLIVIGKTDDLSYLESEVLSKQLLKLNGGERIGAVTVSNKAEAFRELIPEAGESLPHCEDTGADAAVVRAPVAEDRTLYSIHDEPDIAFLSTCFDVSLIGDEITGRLVIIVIHERFDEYGS